MKPSPYASLTQPELEALQERTEIEREQLAARLRHGRRGENLPRLQRAIRTLDQRLERIAEASQVLA